MATTKLKPTLKKNFEITDDEKIIVIDKDNIEGLQRIYHLFFEHRNCTNLFQLLNRFSRVDGILTSGNTQIVIEYKSRNNTSIAEYDSVILEQEKHTGIKESQKALDCPVSFYIMEFSDAVLIYFLTKKDDYQWVDKQLPSTMHNGRLVNKSIAFLPYRDATYIIGKKRWEQANINQLNRYLEIKRNG